jgi:hypothetical protein
VVAGAGFLAGLVSGAELPAGLVSGDELPGGLAGANHASRADHPSLGPAVNDSHTNTSRPHAIRRRTNSSAGHSK